MLPTRAAWQSTVAADKSERTKTKTIVSGVRQAIRLMFAGSVDTLADFGMQPKKAPPVRTPAEKALAAAKAKATRAARGTLGSKQKKAIKGTVTTIVTPASSTAATPVVPAAPGPVATAPAQGSTSTGGTPHAQ